MPFKSEAQRRYLWANEPEIARDWTDTYGSRIQKSNGGIMSMQGGVKNYLGEQPMVNAPKYWQSAPDHEMTELAYITPTERDILVDLNLYGSMQGSPNEGPSGIMSLNGDYSDMQAGITGADISAAERGEGPRGAMSAQDASDFRSAAIVAGAGQRVNPGFFDSRHTVSPAELAAAKEYMNRKNASGEYANPYAKGAWRETRGSGLSNFISGGGILGNLIRGVGQKLGWGKTYDQPTYDMSGYSTLGLGGTGQEGFGVPTQQGDYDVLGNKINEITGEITSPKGESLGFLPGYPGEKSGIETITSGGNDRDNYTQNIIETINESVDENIPNEDLLLRYLGKDRTLDPEAAGFNTVAELRDLQTQRAKDIFTT